MWLMCCSPFRLAGDYAAQALLSWILSMLPWKETKTSLKVSKYWHEFGFSTFLKDRRVETQTFLINSLNWLRNVFPGLGDCLPFRSLHLKREGKNDVGCNTREKGVAWRTSVLLLGRVFMALFFTVAWLLWDVTLSADPTCSLLLILDAWKSLVGVSSCKCSKCRAGLRCSGGEGVESLL